MQDVVYVGTSDYRVLSPADFEKAGTTHAAISFRRGVAVEVSNNLADMITSHDLFGGEFVLSGEEPEGFIPPTPGELIELQSGPSTYGMNTVNWETIQGLQGQVYQNGQPVTEVVDPVDSAYDPGQYNVDDVVTYLTANPDDAERVIKLEQDGKNRVTITGWVPNSSGVDSSGDSGST